MASRSLLHGITVILPPTPEGLAEVAKLFPDDAHIRRVIGERDWHGGGGFQLVLELAPSALSLEAQGNSNTMTATTLLNHYFGVLEKVGLRRRGSPGVVLGMVQLSRNEWCDASGNYCVEGTVFVSPESQQAIVIGKVREHLGQ